MNPSIALSIAALVWLPCAAAKAGPTRFEKAAATTDFASLGYKPLLLEANERSSHWHVVVSINGKPCKLTLDTGADYIILESWGPKYFGLTTEPSDIVARSVGGMKKLVTAEGVLDIGGSTIPKQHFRAHASGDATPAARIKTPLCGVLGLNALRGLGVVLDLRNHTLWIPADPATRIEPLMKARDIAPIPLARTKQSGHLALIATVGGRKLRMVLDSGAERTVLSRKAAETMNLELKESGAIIASADAANSIPMRAELTDITIGKTKLPRLTAHVLPLEEVFKALSNGEAQPVEGILGADVIFQEGGVIDVAAGALYLTGGDGMESTVAGHFVAPLQLSDAMHFTLNGKVNGHNACFALDSGADTILLHAPLAADFGVNLVAGGSSAQGPGGKHVEVFTGKVDRITLPGGIAVENQSFPFLNLGSFAACTIAGQPVKLAGLLGEGFIVSARLIIDCGERRMLVPIKGAMPGDYIRALEKQGGKTIKLLRDERQKLYVPVTIDGEEAALLVDTGASFCTLDADFVKDKGWPRQQEAGSVNTLGQSHQLEKVTPPATRFGPCKVPNVSYALLPARAGQRAQEVGGLKVVGILGSNVMVSLRWVLDFGSDLALIPLNKLNARQEAASSGDK